MACGSRLETRGSRCLVAFSPQSQEDLSHPREVGAARYGRGGRFWILQRRSADWTAGSKLTVTCGDIAKTKVQAGVRTGG